jgi:hypothetical protein
MLPSEIRGPYKATKANVPGIEINEMFPRMAIWSRSQMPVLLLAFSLDGNRLVTTSWGKSESARAAN